MKKTSKKQFKPSYVVDFDDIQTLEDIPVAFALAKHNASIPLTDEELIDIIDWVVDGIRPNITIINCACKKAPWYKRFWRWVKKPFTKKK